MPTPEETLAKLVEEAKAAIQHVHGFTEVPPERTVEALQEIEEEVGVMISSIEEDQPDYDDLADEADADDLDDDDDD